MDTRASVLMGMLYVVATPIGNLDDISLRALRVLADVPLIAAEDTRTTGILLKRHGIRTRLTAYTDHNKRTRIPALITHLHEADLALVSEAGTPAISDPGWDLVAAAIEAGIPVVPLPGASAVLAALVASGLPTRRFLYLGFLPRTGGERRSLFRSIASLPFTLVAYESPHRVAAALADARAVLGDRQAAAARELTKLHEEIVRGRLSEITQLIGNPRGEFTLVIEGASEDAGVPDIEGALAEVKQAVARGMSARDAVSSVAVESGVPRRTLYDAWQRQIRAGEQI